MSLNHDYTSKDRYTQYIIINIKTSKSSIEIGGFAPKCSLDSDVIW